MSADKFRRILADVIGAIRTAKGKVVVLTGAGCSKSAGIPLASGLIAEIKTKYPEAYARAQQNSDQSVEYNAAMEQLSLIQRHDLLEEYIKQARINWAHLALAQLLQHQKIERVLTVNFDNLLIRACGASNFYPAVYDLAATDQYSDKWITQQSLLYVNGQHDGFVTLNTDAELNAHRTKVDAVVNGTGTHVVWVVIGYSGETDPLLDVLAAQKRYDGDLYWINLDDNPSQALLGSGLLADGKCAFYVGSQDADAALTKIAQALDCFPPQILTHPFEHIKKVIASIDFATGKGEAQALQSKLHQRLQTAIDNDSPVSSKTGPFKEVSVNEVNKWLLGGQYQKVQSWYEALKTPDESQCDVGAWGYVLEADALGEKAAALVAQNAAKNLKEARGLWQLAGKKYARALTIKSDQHEAANNWGTALGEEAAALVAQNAAKYLKEARDLWQLAGEKYARALTIKSDQHEVAYNWGNDLGNEAAALMAHDAAKYLEEARDLWQLAGEKYALALTIKSDKHDAANNWGAALGEEAAALMALDAVRYLKEARDLWQLAGEKYARALTIKSDKHEAANNWGVDLGNEAAALVALDAVKYLKEARGLWQLAGEKYALALTIKSDKHEAANNWGNDLGREAAALIAHDAVRYLEEARSLWQLAGEKYALALTIDPDQHEAANSWGVTLGREAAALVAHDAVRYLKEARGLWQLAGEKYALALKIKSDKHEAASNWGSALGQEAKAIKESEPAAAQALLDQAENLLVQHADQSEIGANQVAYNLACVYALQDKAVASVGQLERDRLAGGLPDCDHLRKDNDLDPIRQSAEFQAWWAAHCGDPEV